MSEASHEFESDFLSLTDEIALMIWVADENKSIEWRNKSWFLFTGISSANMPGSNWYNSIHPEDAKICLPIFDNAFSARKNFQFECRLQGKDGLYQWMLIKGIPRFDAKESFLGFAGVCTAILAGPAVSANLENSMAEKPFAGENLRAEIQDKNSEQDRQDSALESFTYIASHDLQEPLRKIQSFSKLILEKEAANFSAAAKNYFSRIISAADRMQRLIDDLLSFSATNVAANSFMPTDLNVVLEEVMQNFQELMLEKKVQLKAGQLPTIPAIRFQLVQLFNNVISNAIKFSKKDATLVITIKAHEVAAQDVPRLNDNNAGNFWHISIADNGIGFEQQYSAKIFELFQRLHGKSEYLGTGIGLAICKKIVINHRGYISATAVPGEGAIFNIYLPTSN